MKTPIIQFFSFSILVLLLMLVSCRSTKKVTNENGSTTSPTTQVTTQGDSGKKDKQSKKKDKKDKQDKQDTATSSLQIAPGTNFTSRVRVTLVQGDKDITTTGTLRMRYDDVIQLVLVDPLLGITEVGRMELSPDNILVIDRLGKRYVSSTYEEFTALKSKNIGFSAIQEFFWQEAKKGDQFSYTLPAKKNIKLDLKLSDKGNASNWTPHTTVSGKYTKTDANQLFGSIIGN